jgi:hypothetical protein
MNIERTADAASPGDTGLPELDDRRIEEIESALFAEIAHDRRARRVRRGRMWLGGTAAAAIVVVAAFTVPAVIRGMGTATGGAALAPQFESGVGGAQPDTPVQPNDSSGSGTDTGGGSGNGSAAGDGSSREVVATATARVEASDVAAAIARISAAAVERKGYVESMSIGSGGATDGTGTVNTDIAPTAPDAGTTQKPLAAAGSGWITVRVPADQLTALIADLPAIGAVQASAIDRADVSDQAIDLRARVAALQASVQRLTELMAKAGSVSDLLAAESALSDRQAALESAQQELKALEDRVAMSSLSVTVSPTATVTTANPAGFGDGLAAGWSGFVATLNGIVVGIGFLLPWLGVAALAGLVVWGVVALLRAARRRSRPAERP